MSFLKKNNRKWKFFLPIEKAFVRFGLFRQISFFEKYAIYFLNIAQCLGVVNDNIFKYLIVFSFIDLYGAKYSPVILTWVGVIYVLPFLLFSSIAGAFADRHSKQKVIVILKLTEMIIMSFGIISLLFKSMWASCILLFFLSTQSAMFGPPKYSIIPEIVRREHIPKANGMITSFTYFGVILGTFLASFLTQITGKNFPLVAGAGMLIAIVGFVASTLIPFTQPKHSKMPIHPFFIYDAYQNLKYASRIPRLLIAILGSASFVFIGAYFQLNIISYAVEAMGCSEVAGGYLFLLTAIGIAGGAFIIGRVSHQRAEMGVACLAGITFSILIFLIGVLFRHPALIYCILFLVGFFCGLYIVPFDSFIQCYSPEKRRGQIVATASFLSFCGVFIAPICLYLLSEQFNFTAAQGFILMSIVIFLVMLLFTMALSGYVCNYLSRILTKLLYRIDTHNSPFGGQSAPFLLILEKTKGMYTFLLSSFSPQMHFYIFREKRGWIDPLLCALFSVSIVYMNRETEEIFPYILGRIEQKKEEIPCLIFSRWPSPEGELFVKWMRESKKTKAYALFFVETQLPFKREYVEPKIFRRSKLTFHFARTYD